MNKSEEPRIGAFRATAETHSVHNVVPVFEDYNAWAGDPSLRQAMKMLGGEALGEVLSDYGAHTGSAAMIARGFTANAHPPVLYTHDRVGQRIDRVDYHPAYHELMADAIGRGIHALPWDGTGSHLERAAMLYLQTQVEQGHGCPLTMTFASVPVLRQVPEIADTWLPRVLSRHYDPRDLPIERKRGATIGMAMTEKQGGSDVRANTTFAQPVSEPGSGRLYELVGHKYFMSAPMCDGFLTLAQTEEGLSCFLVPRWCPDGQKNRLYLQRLKNKLGNISNASSEVEFRAAQGWLIGEQGRGVATILEMVALTRFDCTVASAAAMRQAFVQARHHCEYREAFGARLSEQPLMRAVLTDLELESDAALALSLRLAAALDRAAEPAERALFRLGAALGKYRVCKQVPAHNHEAMECIGGSGVMDEHLCARLYREAPINAIWEGSGNVQCLDILRILERTPDCLADWRLRVSEARSEVPALAALMASVDELLGLDAPTLVYHGRRLGDLLALGLQTVCLSQLLSPARARLFAESRLQAGRGNYGSFGV
ncbi:acyl-CoA dehydrogenase family protein [Marinimicrobium alkaliphilum]|uniref:acyl-CoA dehydrogenase family protein n=1 Tax=Marinimicrobium alkaliphilum TaxID=2202654 RepID=UPI0018E09024|nr:acyl-CoA dehydrogenase family protein [Marinimicrobium alkaliphilum]